MTAPTIHVLDDDPGVRRSLDRLLRAVGYQVRLYESAFALIEAAPGLSGCILLDVRMPDMDGLKVHERLRAGPCPVILMTGHADIEMAVRALKAGAVDFLEKPFPEDKLFEAIEAALHQANAFHVEEIAGDCARKIAGLSPREREVLQALVLGEAHKAIAHQLGISVRTVELHRARMLRRLGTRHLSDAIKVAVLAELAPPPAEKAGRADTASGRAGRE
jgi:two-component system response regulator FixJ